MKELQLTLDMITAELGEKTAHQFADIVAAHASVFRIFPTRLVR